MFLKQLLSPIELMSIITAELQHTPSNTRPAAGAGAEPECDSLMIVSTTCTAGSSTEPLGLLAGMSMEIAGFQGRLDLNGATVKLVSWLPSIRSWSALVIHTNPPEAITVKPENLVAVGSRPPCHISEARRRRLSAECVQWSVGETPECRKRRRESLERDEAVWRRRLYTEARFIEVEEDDDYEDDLLAAECIFVGHSWDRPQQFGTCFYHRRDHGELDDEESGLDLDELLATRNRAAAARAKSRERKTELTFDILVAVCHPTAR